VERTKRSDELGWPRPCLLNQHELISEREACGVFGVRPGITGLAQIQGIEMSTPGLLAITDAKMLKNECDCLFSVYYYYYDSERDC